MNLKVIVLRISGYINYALGFFWGPSKCLKFFNFRAISFLCGDASPLGILSSIYIYMEFLF